MIKTLTIQTVTLFIAFGILDYFWLGYAGKPFYLKYYANLVEVDANGSIQFDIFPALIVYFLMVLGTLIFILPLGQGQYGLTIVHSVLFGLITFGVYNFTSQAVIPGWSMTMSIIDTIWGMIIFTVASLAAVGTTKLFT